MRPRLMSRKPDKPVYRRTRDRRHFLPQNYNRTEVSKAAQCDVIKKKIILEYSKTFSTINNTQHDV